MDAINNLKKVKDNWNVCSRWEVEQDENEARYRIFRDKIPSDDKNISIFKNKGKTLTDAINVMDQISINKSENALVSVHAATHSAVTILGGLGALGGYLMSKILKHKAHKTAAFIGYTVATLIGASIGSFITSHFAKTSTRVARYQTRNNEMQDVRNFVTYTDEQIKQAKEKLSSTKDINDVTEDMTIKESLNPLKVYSKSFEDIKSLKKDYEKYKNWRTQYAKDEIIKDEKLKQIKLTEDEQKEAEKDKNFVLKTINKLEIASNRYEINTSFAVKATAVLLSLLTVGGGFISSWGLGKISNNLRAGKLTNILKYCSKLSIPAGIASLFFLVGPLAKLSKDSAKLGRFRETEKLLSEDKNFYPHTDGDIEQIKLDNKFNPKTKWDLVKDNFKFIFGLKQDYMDFLKYKNTKHKETLKLREILKNTPITREQLEDAQKLQKQTFMAFEKIDDKSECLVDDTTAAVNVGTNLINGTACCLANILTLKLFGKELSKFSAKKTLPGFFEGLKLSKNLSLKQMSLIFIAPYLVTRGIILLTSLIGTEIKKKSCKIGVMSAMQELDDAKKFAYINKKKGIFSQF